VHLVRGVGRPTAGEQVAGVSQHYRTQLAAWRVTLVNAAGLTSGPFMTAAAWPWASVLIAGCHRHPTPAAAPGCTCGVYATETREALAPLVRSASEATALAALSKGQPPAGRVMGRDSDGMPALADPRTSVVVLAGTLERARLVHAPPLRYWPTTRRMLLHRRPRWRAALAGIDLDAVIFHDIEQGTEPPGTWRGGRFTAHEVHAADPPAWLAELVAPLPLVHHRDAASLTGRTTA